MGITKADWEASIADRWLSREATEASGFFRPSMLRALRAAHGALPAKSGVRNVLEGLLMTAIPAHLLDHLFCRDFSVSLDRYGVAPSGDPIPGLS